MCSSLGAETPVSPALLPGYVFCFWFCSVWSHSCVYSNRNMLHFVHFVQSAQKVSGSADSLTQKVFQNKASKGSGTTNDATVKESIRPAAKMFQLTYKNDQAHWSESG